MQIDIIGALSDAGDMVFCGAYGDAGTTSELCHCDWWVGLPAGSELVNLPKTRANLVYPRTSTYMVQMLCSVSR